MQPHEQAVRQCQVHAKPIGGGVASKCKDTQRPKEKDITVKAQPQQSGTSWSRMWRLTDRKLEELLLKIPPEYEVNKTGKRLLMPLVLTVAPE